MKYDFEVVPASTTFDMEIMLENVTPQDLQLISIGMSEFVHGFGVKVRLDQNHFVAEWGVGLNRYQVRLSRVDGHKLKRVILLGSDGYISLESLRFIADVGATFSMIDKRGKSVMVCSPVSPSDSRLRRAQSLAITNGSALRISKELIRQ